MSLELTPVIEPTIDDELWELYKPNINERIPSKDCQVGFLYWGVGRSISEVAICSGYDLSHNMLFLGLRNKFGKDYLSIELHQDDDQNYGTWSPILKLEQVPENMNINSTMQWLLQKEIDLISTRINWLHAVPERLQAAPSYSWLLEEDTQHLHALELVEHNGFSSESTMPLKTYVQINYES